MINSLKKQKDKNTPIHYAQCILEIIHKNISHRIKPHLVENNITLTEKDDEVYNQGHRRT